MRLRASIDNVSAEGISAGVVFRSVVLADNTSRDLINRVSSSVSLHGEISDPTVSELPIRPDPSWDSRPMSGFSLMISLSASINFKKPEPIFPTAVGDLDISYPSRTGFGIYPSVVTCIHRLINFRLSTCRTEIGTGTDRTELRIRSVLASLSTLKLAVCTGNVFTIIGADKIV